MKFIQGMARDDPMVDLEGHRSKVKVTRSEIVILGLIVVLQEMRPRSRSHGSRSEVTLVKVGQMLKILAGGLTSTSSCIFF